MTYCTLCSGSELPAIAVNEAIRCLRACLDHPTMTAITESVTGTSQHQPPTLRQTFLCELDDEKRKLAMRISDGSDICCFKDITHMSQRTAHCYRHNCDCPIPRSDGAWDSEFTV
eukprot:1372924-Pyramimonas_sp.AAC.1